MTHLNSDLLESCVCCILAIGWGCFRWAEVGGVFYHKFGSLRGAVWPPGPPVSQGFQAVCSLFATSCCLHSLSHLAVKIEHNLGTTSITFCTWSKFTAHWKFPRFFSIVAGNKMRASVHMFVFKIWVWDEASFLVPGLVFPYRFKFFKL